MKTLPALTTLVSTILLSTHVLAAEQLWCALPHVDMELRLHIPCIMRDGNSASANFPLDNNQDDYYWQLGELAASICRPHIAACRSYVDAEFGLNVLGMALFGVQHDAHFNFASGMSSEGMFAWHAPMLYSPTRKSTAITIAEPLGSATFSGGKTLNLDVGVGSGAFHYAGAPYNVIYTVTDRGPNIPCSDSPTLLDTDNICVQEGAADEDGKIFPMPEFTPSIYQLHFDADMASYHVMAHIPLKDSNGNVITGLTNPLNDTENGYAPDGSLRAFDPNGLDTEALVRLSDGTFWLAEEYAPSLVHVAADGTILQRLVPAGVEAQLDGATYPVTGMLPAILHKRKLNRGIESIAVSLNEKYLYFALQSPLANPDGDAYKASRNLRLFKLGLEGGNVTEVLGEYIYHIDTADSFPLDGSTKQSDVKVSEMVAIADDMLIVLERISKHTKLYRVPALPDTANILGSVWDDEATTPSLEQTDVATTNDIVVLHKELAFDSAVHAPDLPSKIEGVALLDNEFVALINDNDFGIAGDSSKINVLPIYPQLLNRKTRFATFNAALNRSEAGALVSDLSTSDNEQARNVAEIIQLMRPDVLSLQEFDYDAEGEALRLFQTNYLSVSQHGAEPIAYPYTYVVPSNTGVPSGLDFDNNGEVSGGNDAYGFGNFEGQYAFAILSRYPIDTANIRTFQNFLWKDMPNALLPKNPATGENYYSDAALNVFRLSSKNHVDVPIQLPTGLVHILVAHPTPPVYDGDEDRNGLRNHDEIRLFTDYVSGSDYLVDDNGVAGGLAADANFVIMGDMNADLVDGDSSQGAALQFLANSRINQSVTIGEFMPYSQGGVENNVSETDASNPGYDTASWGLRADYVLPSKDMTVLETGIFWPTQNDPLYYLVEYNPDENKPGSSDHRMVWADVEMP